MENNDLEKRVTKLERENKDIFELLRKLATTQNELARKMEIAQIIKEDPSQEKNEIVDDSGQDVFM